MRLAWVPIGRERERGIVRAALGRGRGIALVGEAGVGKTTLVRTVVEAVAAADGAEVAWVTASEVARTVPLGAFAPLLRIGWDGDATTVLFAALQVLRRDPATILVVDDAHLLDALSATLLHQLALGGSRRLIVTARADVPLPDSVTALWKDDLIDRMTVAPLSQDEVRCVLRGELGGPVHPLAENEFWRGCQGNVLLLRLLVEGAVEAGRLDEQAGQWNLNGQVVIGRPLADLLRTKLGQLDDATRRALHIVAMAGEIDVEVLAQLVAEDTLDHAEAAGLLSVTARGMRMAAKLSHPLLARVVDSELPEGDRAALSAEVVAVMLRRLPDSSAERIQLAQLMVGSGQAQDLDFLIRSALRAVTLTNATTGEQIARHAVEHGGGLAAALVLAEALSWQGRGAEAETVLQVFDVAQLDPAEELQWTCGRAINLFLACGQPDLAEQLLAAACAHLVQPRMSRVLGALGATFAFFRGRVEECVALGLPVVRDPDSPLIAVVWSAAAVADALASAGRFDEVPEVTTRGRWAADRCVSGLHRFAIGYARVNAALLAGEFDEADRLCVEYDSIAVGEPQALAIVNLARGRAALSRGNPQDAVGYLRQSLAVIGVGSPQGWRPVVAANLACAEAALGDPDSAVAALALVGSHADVQENDLLLAQAWVAAAQGRSSEAVRHARASAALAAQRGAHAVEAVALHHASMWGDMGAAARLAQLADRIGGLLVPLMARFARAATARDGDELHAVGEAFEGVGAALMAVPAFALAAREFLLVGRAQDAETAAGRARALGGGQPNARRMGVLPATLTAREREIAYAAARGLSTKAIATSRGVTVRTVENHLHRIYLKLGVSARAELAALLGTDHQG